MKRPKGCKYKTRVKPRTPELLTGDTWLQWNMTAAISSLDDRFVSRTFWVIYCAQLIKFIDWKIRETLCKRPKLSKVSFTSILCAVIAEWLTKSHFSPTGLRLRKCIHYPLHIISLSGHDWTESAIGWAEGTFCWAIFVFASFSDINRSFRWARLEAFTRQGISALANVREYFTTAAFKEHRFFDKRH